VYLRVEKLWAGGMNDVGTRTLLYKGGMGSCAMGRPARARMEYPRMSV